MYLWYSTAERKGGVVPDFMDTPPIATIVYHMYKGEENTHLKMIQCRMWNGSFMDFVYEATGEYPEVKDSRHYTTHGDLRISHEAEMMLELML